MYHRGIIFLRIFLLCFADRVNFNFPLQRKILQPITFGLVIPDKTANITRSGVNFKTVTQSKQFSGFILSWFIIRTLLKV